MQCLKELRNLLLVPDNARLAMVLTLISRGHSPWAL